MYATVVQRLILAVVLLVCCAGAFAQNEQTYQSESKSWSVTKPNDWNPIGFAVIREIEGQNRYDYPNKNFKYVLGFTRGGMNTMNYPYVLINVTDANINGLSYDDIDRGLALTAPKSKADKLLASLVSQFAWGVTTVDRDHNRTIGTVHLPKGRKGPVRVTVYSYLGERGVVQFECYDLEANGNKNDGAVAQLVDTFSYADGNAFMPTAGLTKGGSREAEKTVAAVMLGAIVAIAVLIGVIVLVAKALKKT